MLSLQLRGGAVRQLVGLITQRSLVQIRPPLLAKLRGYGSGCNPFFVAGCAGVACGVVIETIDGLSVGAWDQVPSCRGCPAALSPAVFACFFPARGVLVQGQDALAGEGGTQAGGLGAGHR